MSEDIEDPAGFALDALFDFVTGREFETKDGRKVRVQAVETVDPKTGAAEHVETTPKAGDSDRRSEGVASERVRIEHIFRAPKSSKHPKRANRTSSSEDTHSSDSSDDSDSKR